MHTHKTFPWEGADAEYCGTLSTLDHSNKTGRERRGKCKVNKAEPRGMRGHRYPRRPHNRQERGKVEVRAAVAPEVVRYAVGTHILTED